MLQQLDLTQRPLGENLFAEDICDFLDGHSFASLRVLCGAVMVENDQPLISEFATFA